MSDNYPVIRRRVPTSRRRRDGLIQFAKDVTSQGGEDGVIGKLFELLPSKSQHYCVDVGAWDGRHLSNTFSLLQDPSQWKGVLIEADPDRFLELQSLHTPLGNTCVNAVVSSDTNSNSSLVSLLPQHAPSLPQDFDFLSIDVDGSDYWLLHDIWELGQYRPRVVCIEANPTMPDDLVYIPARNDTIRHGASLSALVELAAKYGYTLVETTLFNAFFVPHELYEAHLRDLVPDTSIEALHEVTMGTSLYQLYDGTLKLWGCKKLLWHRLAMDEQKMQMIPAEKRHFPFTPKPLIPDNVVDLSPFCKLDSAEPRLQDLQNECSDALLKQLRTDGFALIRGTGIRADVCQDALHVANSFLQEADESVRRSCLAKDRARRGYSPMATENFASLVGEKGPNDLVRKFRVGPTTQEETPTSNSPLHRPNVWPSGEVWDSERCQEFQSTAEDYYTSSSSAANAVVRAICNGLIRQDSHLESSLKVVRAKEDLAHTSILTMLGYRRGTRHKKTQKKRVVHPLVASHTDVGVITMLLFDGEHDSCAMLQRQALQSNHAVHDENWVNVTLPSPVPDDPIFVVNVGDCLSDLSHGSLPSTLHRVVAVDGGSPRNCLALFVGLNPKEMLTLPTGTVTYEEWRKLRIDKSQAVLREAEGNL